MDFISEVGAYKGLAAAIVLQAAEDYGMALLGQFHDPVKDNTVKDDCERFFKSDELHLYTNIPGEAIMEKVQKMTYSWPKGKKFTLYNNI